MTNESVSQYVPISNVPSYIFHLRQFKERLKYYLTDHMRNKLMNILTDMMECHQRQRAYLKDWTNDSVYFTLVKPFVLILFKLLCLKQTQIKWTSANQFMKWLSVGRNWIQQAIRNSFQSRFDKLLLFPLVWTSNKFADPWESNTMRWFIPGNCSNSWCELWCLLQQNWRLSDNSGSKLKSE